MGKSVFRNVKTYVQDKWIPILGAARAEELNSMALHRPASERSAKTPLKGATVRGDNP